MTSVYLDASVLVSLHLRDANTGRALALFRGQVTDAVISDFGAAEVSSAVALNLRIGRLAREQAQSALRQFDEWIGRDVAVEHLDSADVALADAFIRRLDSTLRTPDALHLAIARRLSLPVATFDVKMAAAARNFGIKLLES